MKIPTNVQVLESKDDVLILGNDWLSKVKASLDWHDQTLTIHFHRSNENKSDFADFQCKLADLRIDIKISE